MTTDMKDENNFPEAGAVAYFGYKRTDGFEISLTLRDKTGKELLKRLDGAIAEVIKAGGTPLPLRGGFPSKLAKPVNYVEGRTCPLCHNRLVHAETKDGRKFIKCETNKWDFATKQSIGCKYTDWGDKPTNGNIPDRDINDY
jgi:hypothetical protein